MFTKLIKHRRNHKCELNEDVYTVFHSFRKAEKRKESSLWQRASHDTHSDGKNKDRDDGGQKKKLNKIYKK